MPAIICFYGTTSGAGKDTTVGLSGGKPGTPPERNRAFAVDMAEAGFVALAADYLRDGERIKPGRRPYDTTDFYKQFPDWSVHGKDAWDTMRAVDYLQIAGLRRPRADRDGRPLLRRAQHHLHDGPGAADQGGVGERPGVRLPAPRACTGRCPRAAGQQPVAAGHAAVRAGSHADDPGHVLRVDGADRPAAAGGRAGGRRAAADGGGEPRRRPPGVPGSRGRRTG